MLQPDCFRERKKMKNFIHQPRLVRIGRNCARGLEYRPRRSTIGKTNENSSMAESFVRLLSVICIRRGKIYPPTFRGLNEKLNGSRRNYALFHMKRERPKPSLKG